MDTLITCRCGHGATVHFFGSCHASRCACSRSQEEIIDAELHAAREEHLEMYRRYAEPDRRDSA